MSGHFVFATFCHKFPQQRLKILLWPSPASPFTLGLVLFSNMYVIHKQADPSSEVYPYFPELFKIWRSWVTFISLLWEFSNRQTVQESSYYRIKLFIHAWSTKFNVSLWVSWGYLSGNYPNTNSIKAENQLVLVIAGISGYTDPWTYFLSRHLFSS